uniref:ShKT domain-containing protein n=1 Tax=Daphnia galeata TaxID=27404 RepID=A0A8J2W4L0_9CRUS|nr:unnamed protein product [Daphnia galeata]
MLMSWLKKATVELELNGAPAVEVQLETLVDAKMDMSTDPLLAVDGKTAVDPNNGECSNLNDNCIRWAKGGECQKNEEYIEIYCRKSCLLCNEPAAAATSAKSECVDDDHYCPVWATEGDGCKGNPGFMLLHCRKSCGEC